MSLLSDHLVWCNHCCSLVDEREATYLGEDIGPDLLYYDVYICDDCQNEIELDEDEY